MPIQLPNLDNKTFNDLMKEMIASIPKHTKEWTNFNPSDPGMAMLELLAWICETLIYRANRIPEESYINFLRLVAGSREVYDPTDKAHLRILEYLQRIEGGWTRDIQEMKAEAQRFLNSRYRAVTKEDFRELTLEASPRVKRAEIKSTSGRVAIIVIPEDADLQKTDELHKTVRDYLEPRRLIGTPIDVKAAEYTPVNLKVTLIYKSYANQERVKESVEKAVKEYLDPIKGGPDGQGWPYGRNLMVYELFYIIEQIDGVEHVQGILESGKSFTEINVNGLISLKIVEVEGAEDE